MYVRFTIEAQFDRIFSAYFENSHFNQMKENSNALVNMFGSIGALIRNLVF